MKLSLTNGLDKDQHKGLENSFNNAGVFRERLKEVLEDRAKQSLKPTQYDKASWPYLQADSIGYTRALQEVINLISLKD